MVKFDSIHFRKAKLSESRKAELKTQKDQNFTGQTRFDFINQHNGLRPGKVHVLMSGTGAGKSTFTRTLVKDLVGANKILYYSTEEPIDEIELSLMENETNYDWANENLFFKHERDTIKALDKAKLTHKDVLLQLEFAIKASGAKILIWDNLTASNVFELDLDEAQKLVEALMSFANRTGVAVFIVAHTKKGTKAGILTADDVRGPATTTMRADFLYILQSIQVYQHGQEKIINIVTVDKCRGFPSIRTTNWLLFYDYQCNQYTGCSRLSFQKFKELYLERNKL